MQKNLLTQGERSLSMSNLLLLEDDISLIDGLHYSLKKNGFYVDIARTVEEAEKQLAQIEKYDLLILDVTLPDGTGFEVCENVRKHNKQIPIIFLTASDEEVNIIRGLDCGGDDYVTKPFKLGELCSRIRALLRRAGVTPQDKASVLKCGDISIDFLSCRVILNNKILELTNAEYRLLCLLVRNANRIVSRDIILNDLWDGTGNFVDDNTLSVYIRRLREKIVSALLEQEVSKEVIANAISSTDISTAGMEFLDNLGITTNTFGSLLPHFSQFQYHFLRIALGGGICLVIILVIGVISFLQIRNNLYRQSGKIIDNYINNDYSCHLPQDSEGDLFHLFASVEQLATMLKAKSETEHKTKEFLKSTISDISHQLKTPLAALMMYQEIIEAEPDNTETVKKFSQKTGTALKRIEQLILSMLKIARLDTGNILFDKRTCLIQELVKNAISELTIRATQEKKQIIVNGTSNQVIMCDMDWTSEAIGNLVKNALDHTEIGGIVKITWESTPTMIRILVSDNGSGIAPEDIHHIFKRFYRSKYSLNTPGIGLGLPLAKSIIEGQEGLISVQSVLHEGTTFSVSFLTKS